MPVNPALLEKTLEAIKKEYGEHAVHDGAGQPPIARIPTGSVELDYITGGGVPIGRWMHFYGAFSSSKTLTCWNVIREAQKLGQDCVYYNVEKQYDEVWAKAHGIDTKKLIIVEGSTIEGVGTKLEALLKVAHVHVIDSLAAAVSLDELNAKTEDWHMGLAARVWGKVLRRANERFDENENTIIMVNQTRDVFGYGGGEAPTGGKMIEYLSSLSMSFRKAGWLFKDSNGTLSDEGSNESMSGDKEPEGMEFVVRVQKSRVCPPFRTARLRLDFSNGQFDELWALAKAAKHFNVIDVKSGYYTMPDGSKIHGAPKFREALSQDLKLQKQIADAMSKAA